MEGGETGNRWHGKKKTIMGEGARGKTEKKKKIENNDVAGASYRVAVKYISPTQLAVR